MTKILKFISGLFTRQDNKVERELKALRKLGDRRAEPRSNTYVETKDGAILTLDEVVERLSGKV